MPATILKWARNTMLLVCALAASLAYAQVRELRVGVASHVRTLDVQEMTSNSGASFLY